MQTKTLILFDLVGTLTDAGPRYARAFSDTCQQFGYQGPQDDDSVIGLLGERNLKQITDQFVGPLEDAEQQEFMATCNSQCDALLYSPGWIERLYPNVRETLRDLHAQNYVLGVFTGTRDDAAASQLRYHNIQQYFDPAYVRGKDNERDAHLDSESLKIQQLASIMDVFDGDEVIVVGDSASDYKAATYHGCRFIGFNGKALGQQNPVIYGAEFVRDHADIVEAVHRGAMPALKAGSSKPQGPRL